MLHVAIIGAGAISSVHMKAFLEFPNRCNIVALCDVFPEKAKQLKERFNLSADVYDSTNDLLRRNDIDLISICTPPYTHAEIAIDALNSGKHVLVEKPMAS